MPWICLNHPDGERLLAEHMAARAKPRHPLDHDGDGRKGGSLPRKRKAKP